MYSVRVVCGTMAQSSPSAQTERRGDAGPVGGLLGDKDRTGRFYFRRSEIRSQLR
jgi:hypothetical protein